MIISFVNLGIPLLSLVYWRDAGMKQAPELYFPPPVSVCSLHLPSPCPMYLGVVDTPQTLSHLKRDLYQNK